MLKLVIDTALLYSPLALLWGALGFFAVRWSLRRKNKVVRRIVKAGLLLCLAALTAGVLYGILRFSGTIMFADDNTISYNWFDASWRDDGFEYVYKCGIAFVVIAAAVLSERKQGDGKQDQD